MRNLKKVLALALALVMTLSVMSFASAATAGTSFSDDASITQYDEAIQVLEALGIFKGGDGNEFNANTTITREQAAAILYRVYTGDVNDESVELTAGTYMSAKFTDVQTGAWYAGYVGYCYNKGLMKGYDNGKFGIGDNLTGWQMVVMVLRAIGYDQEGEFTGADWELQAASRGYQEGVTSTLRGVELSSEISRGAVAELIFRAIAKTSSVTYTKNDGYAKTGLTVGYSVFGLCGDRETYYTCISSHKTGSLTSKSDYVLKMLTTRGTAVPDTTADDTGTNQGNGDRVQADLDATGNITARYGEPVAFWYAKSLENSTNSTGAIAVRFNTVKTYTTSVNDETLFADSGAAGTSVDAYVAEDGYTTAANAKYTLYKAANGGTWVAGGNGTLTELYVADGDVFVVIKNTYVDDVNTKVAANSKDVVLTPLALDNTAAAGIDANTNTEKLSLAGFGVDDVVIFNKYTLDDGTTYYVDYTTIQLAEHKVLTPTAVKTVSTGTPAAVDPAQSYFKVDSTTYNYNKTYDASTVLATTAPSDLDVAQDVYFDNYGYVVKANDAVNPSSTGVYLILSAVNYRASTNHYYLTVTALDGTGKQVTLKAVADSTINGTSYANITGTANADGTYDNDDAQTVSKYVESNYAGYLMTGTTNSAGYVVLSEGYDVDLASGGLVQGDANSVTTENVDSTTVFVVETVDAKTSNATYKYYTGIKNVPSVYDASDTANDSDEDAYGATVGDTQYILIKNAKSALVTTTGTVDTSKFFYVIDKTPEEVNKPYDEYNVIIDGKVTTIKTIVGLTPATTDAAFTVGHLYEITGTESGTGYVASADVVSIWTTTIANATAGTAHSTPGIVAYQNDVLTVDTQAGSTTKITLDNNCVIVKNTDGSALTTEDLVEDATVTYILNTAGYASSIIVTP